MPRPRSTDGAQLPSKNSEAEFDERVNEDFVDLLKMPKLSDESPGSRKKEVSQFRRAGMDLIRVGWSVGGAARLISLAVRERISEIESEIASYRFTAPWDRCRRRDPNWDDEKESDFLRQVRDLRKSEGIGAYQAVKKIAFDLGARTAKDVENMYERWKRHDKAVKRLQFEDLTKSRD